MTSNNEAAASLEHVLFEIKKVIVGQDHMVERLLVALLARGHVLLEGLPGLAKTLAVSTLARSIGGSFVRLQFTPDLLPSDLIGTRIWRASDERFDIEWGPVFANLVLTDEINRAPAKVQSALLEVMAERQVSIGGTTRPLPDPFLVLATQNPVESEGVYTLPEAQRDRFLMKVIVGYPSPDEEMEIIRRMGVSAPEASQALTLAELAALQKQTDEVYVDAAIAQYAVDLVMATREPTQRGLPELEPLIDFGVSPRASLGLVAASRALALLRGRTYVVPQDVFDVARDVLRHRLMLSYEALAQGLNADAILHRILGVVPAAAISPIELERKVQAATGTGGRSISVDDALGLSPLSTTGAPGRPDLGANPPPSPGTRVGTMPPPGGNGPGSAPATPAPGAPGLGLSAPTSPMPGTPTPGAAAPGSPGPTGTNPGGPSLLSDNEPTTVLPTATTPLPGNAPGRPGAPGATPAGSESSDTPGDDAKGGTGGAETESAPGGS